MKRARVPVQITALCLIAVLAGCGNDPAGTTDNGDGTLPMWAVNPGGTDTDFGNRIAVAADGSLYIVGFFAGVSVFGPDTLTSAGSFDGFLARYTPDGTCLWGRSMGGPNSDNAHGVTVAGGRVWVAGEFVGTGTFGGGTIGADGGAADQDGFLVSYDEDGNGFGVFRISGTQSGDVARAVQAGADGSVNVVGSFNTAVSFAGTPVATAVGGVDGFLIHFQPSSGTRWVQTVGSTSSDDARAVTVDAAGNVIVAGLFRDTATVGDTTLTSAGLADIFVAKYSAAGAFLWAWQAGSTTTSDFAQELTTVGENIYLSALFGGTMTVGGTTLMENGNGDVAVIALDSDGGVRWAKSFGSTNVDYAGGLAPASDGGVYVAGRFFDSVTIGTVSLTGDGSQSFLARYRSSGSLLWAQSGGGIDQDGIYSMRTVPGNGIAMVGAFLNDATWGTHTLKNHGGHDVVLIRTGSSGWK